MAAHNIGSNLGFNICRGTTTSAIVEEMLKSIVESRIKYEGLSKRAKARCRDHFAKTMAVNFVILSNEVECTGTHTLDGTREVLENYLESHQASELSKHDKEYTNTYETLRYSFYGPLDDPGNEDSWSALRASGLLTVIEVCGLHAMLLKDLKLQRGDGGTVRKKENGRSGEVEASYNGRSYRYPPPEKLEDGFYSIIDRHNIHMDGRKKDGEITLKDTTYVFKCAAWLLLRLLSLHPFYDGNGRLCRILANYVLSRITPFPVSVYNSKSSDRNRDNYLQAIVHSRENREIGPGELAFMLVEGAYLGWQDLFQYLEAGGLVGTKLLLGPIAVRKSRMHKSDVEERVQRLKDISGMEEEVLAKVQSAVESADTSELTEPDQHIIKELEFNCEDVIMSLRVEIYC